MNKIDVNVVTTRKDTYNDHLGQLLKEKSNFVTEQ